MSTAEPRPTHPATTTKATPDETPNLRDAVDAHYQHVAAGHLHVPHVDATDLDAWAGDLAYHPITAPPPDPQPERITAEAERLVYGDREDDYGHPRDNFTRTARLWDALLADKMRPGAHLDAEDVGRLMIAAKLSRDVNTPKRDNRVDMCGFALNLDRLETGQ